MFSMIDFHKETNALILEGKRQEAIEQMLRAYSDLKAAGNTEDLEYVVSRIAHFYATPGAEDLEKAEKYFLEAETLLPGCATKYQTAMFYFYVVRDFSKSIKKVDEITLSGPAADRANYYSALTLKGQALIELKRMKEAKQVLEEMLAMVKTNPSKLPYGDEFNFLRAAIAKPLLAGKAREALRLTIPRIRSQEYVEKAKALLESS